MKSILETIKDEISKIDFDNKNLHKKAIDVCVAIYDMYVYQKGDFYQYKSLSSKYFDIITKSKAYSYIIIKKLKEYNIIECDNSYNVVKGIGKGYRFNKNLLGGEYILEGTIGNIKSDKVQTSILEGTIGNIKSDKVQTLSSFISNNLIYNLYNNLSLYYNCSLLAPGLDLESIEIDVKVYDFISNFNLKREDILVDDEITDEYVIIDEYRYKRENAILFTIENNTNLIKYKERFYFEKVNDFLIRKTNDLKLIYKKSIFDIENKIFRISRNETNYRLDYNFTNMKSDLLEYIMVDGEKLIELDIANSQFAILSNLFYNHLDKDFNEFAQNGTLYEYISSKLNISREDSKKKMMRVAFDKVKKEQDDLRSIFPKMMKFIDALKNTYGYKIISSILQIIESTIMIDYILPELLKKELKVFPIHDAFRVKKSDLESVYSEITKSFKEIDFKCNLRNKKEKVNKDINLNEKSQYEEDIEFWEAFNPKPTSTKSIEDEDFGDGNEIDGLIEIG